MRTATRPRPTLGRRLAAKVSKPRRKPSTRPRRDSADAADARRLAKDRTAEVKRLLKDVRTLAAERQLEQSPMGRGLLRLTDRRSKARYREQFAGLALVAARENAERCRSEHSGACNQLRHGEFEKVWGKLRAAEGAVRRAKRLHAAAVTARELVDCELRTLEQASEQAR